MPLARPEAGCLDAAYRVICELRRLEAEWNLKKDSVPLKKNSVPHFNALAHPD